MEEINNYTEGQPIESVEETRVYVHKNVLKCLELYQEIGTISQLRALKEERDKYFLELQQYRAIGTVEEFIEKLIGRLDELYDINDKAKKEAYEERDWEEFDLYMHRNEGVYMATAIVNQLAKKYRSINTVN